MIDLALTAGIYLLPGVWTGGCEVTYRIDSSASSYSRAIPWATGQLTAITGITFTPVAAGPADITFMQHRKSHIPVRDTDGVIGLWQPETSTVWLTYTAPNVRRGLALHETMHALGAAHSPEIESVMNAEGYNRTAFQQDDLDTLNWISIRNQCDPEWMGVQ